MGGFNPFKTVKKTLKDVTKGVGNLVETVVEKPIKKIGKETFDIATGTTDEERRYLLYGETPEVTSEITPEVTPEVVPDDTLMSRGTRRTKGKRAGAAGTLMEGYGVTYAKPSAKAPTGGSA